MLPFIIILAGFAAPERRLPDSPWKEFYLHHTGCPGLIDGPGIDDGCRFFVTAQHNHQVAHHGGLFFFVELDNFLLLSSSRAISTMLTAPSTILKRAATMAAACWRFSIAWAISWA